MNKLWLGSVACITVVAAVPAGAADLPPAPAYKAAMVPPIYDWTGFYAGLHLGGAWDHRSVNAFNTVNGALVGTASTSGSGIMGGGQIGYNYMFAPSWVIGLEADISGADLTSSTQGVNVRAGILNRGVDNVDLFGTVRGRLGYAVGNWLFYGTGGFAWADDKLTRTQLMGTVGNATPGTVESVSKFDTGWTAGGGIEWGFVPNWTAKIEYLHLDLGTQTFVFPIAQRRQTDGLTIETVLAGVNYRF